MAKSTFTLILLACVLMLTGSAHGQTILLGTTNGNSTPNPILFRVNLSTGAGTVIGSLPFGGEGGGITELVINRATGQAWVQGADGAFQIQQMNPATGAAIGGVVGDQHAFNGLQFLGNVLYGVSIDSSRGPSTLRLLNPATGTSTAVGLTGYGPMSGLAWNGSILYGIEGGGGEGGGGNRLFTINTSTGAATAVGSSGIAMGSLSFGPDGNLYAGGADSRIYRINPATGAATLVGPTGFADAISGLALYNGTTGSVAVPALSGIALVGLAILLLASASLFLLRRQRA